MILKDQHHPETNTYLRICSLPDNPVSVDNEITKESSAPVSRVLFRHDLSAITSVPVIYLLRKSPCGSSVLPSIGISRAGNPQTMVYANLQPPNGTARRSPAGWWSLTPPSHPYHIIYMAVVFFCRLLLSPIASTFGSGAPCAARTFLLCHKDTGDKPWHCVLFLNAKVNKNVGTDN